VPEIIADQNHIWGDGGGSQLGTRGWAELAYWFPAFTVPAGAQTLQALDQPVPRGRNVDMSKLGAGDEGGTAVLSHGYLKGKEFSRVFGAYQAIRGKFQEQ